MYRRVRTLRKPGTTALALRCDAVQEPRSFKIRMPEAEAGVLSLVLDQSEQAAFRVADPFLLSQSTGVCQSTGTRHGTGFCYIYSYILSRRILI